MMNEDACSQQIREMYPQIDWKKFDGADTVLNFDLWYGTVHEYYPSAEDWPNGYVYQGCQQACNDIEELLAELPHEMWYDNDSGYVTDKDPYDDEYGYTYPCNHCAEWVHLEHKGKWVDKEYVYDVPKKDIWVDNSGGDCCTGDDEGFNEGEPHDPDYSNGEYTGGEWEKFNVRKVLMFKETYSQVF